MVRAKFKLTSIEWNYGVARKLVFTTQYDQTIPEDQRFYKATPSGRFEMLVDNPKALEMFKLGEDYYFDASPAPAPQT